MPISVVKAMSVTLLQQSDTWCLQFTGTVPIQSVAELKSQLVAWLAAGTELNLNLQAVDEIDLMTLHLLHAAVREGISKGLSVFGTGSHAVTTAVGDSGFGQLPGFPFQE